MDKNPIKLTVDELKQLRHLLALVEATILLSLQHLLCTEEILLQFRQERKKLLTLIPAIETYFEKYISTQQILAITWIAKTGETLLPALYEKNLVAKSYVDDFSKLLDIFQQRKLIK